MRVASDGRDDFMINVVVRHWTIHYGGKKKFSLCAACLESIYQSHPKSIASPRAEMMDLDEFDYKNIARGASNVSENVPLFLVRKLDCRVE